MSASPRADNARNCATSLLCSWLSAACNAAVRRSIASSEEIFTDSLNTSAASSQTPKRAAAAVVAIGVLEGCCAAVDGADDCAAPGDGDDEALGNATAIASICERSELASLTSLPLISVTMLPIMLLFALTRSSSPCSSAILPCNAGLALFGAAASLARIASISFCIETV